MKTAELRKKTKTDLAEILVEKQKRRGELIELLREKKVKNVKELREARKDIARILTLLKESKYEKS